MLRLAVYISATGFSKAKERNEPSVNTCLRVADSNDTCLQHVATCTQSFEETVHMGQEVPTTVHGVIPQRTRCLPL